MKGGFQMPKYNDFELDLQTSKSNKNVSTVYASNGSFVVCPSGTIFDHTWRHCPNTEPQQPNPHV